MLGISRYFSTGAILSMAAVLVVRVAARASDGCGLACF